MKFVKVRKGPSGFSSVEMIVGLGVVCALVLVFSLVQYSNINKARTITLQHDLLEFAKSQNLRFVSEKPFSGVPGQKMGREVKADEFRLEGFTPSKDISFLVLSGNPDNPYAPENPYRVRAMHSKLKKTLIYDFCTQKITESDKEENSR